MLDIESFFLALKAAWFKRIILNNEDWSFIPRNKFSFCDNLKLLLQMHFNSKLIKNNKLSSFYCQILDAYMLTNEEQNDDSQILWGNEHFSIKINKVKQIIFFNNWIDAGIVYVKDLKF